MWVPQMKKGTSAYSGRLYQLTVEAELKETDNLPGASGKSTIQAHHTLWMIFRPEYHDWCLVMRQRDSCSSCAWVLSLVYAARFGWIRPVSVPPNHISGRIWDLKSTSWSATSEVYDSEKVRPFLSSAFGDSTRLPLLQSNQQPYNADVCLGLRILESTSFRRTPLIRGYLNVGKCLWSWHICSYMNYLP